MAVERILVPIDGSAVSTGALTFAIERATVYNAQITVAFAVNRIAVAMATATPYTYADPTPLLEALDAEASAVLNAGETLVKAAGIAHDAVKLDGAAAPAILSYAKKMGADWIVMGTHGRTGFERFALGSTAEEIVRAAGVPVFVVPSRSAVTKKGSVAHALVAVDGSPAADEALKPASWRMPNEPASAFAW